MDSNTRVKECPYRMKENHALRGEIDDWVYRCKIQHIRIDVSENSQDIFCHLHGNSKLCKCKFYNEYSEKQVRDAFKKLEKLESHKNALKAVMEM